jgi:hypothetical protein
MIPQNHPTRFREAPFFEQRFAISNANVLFDGKADFSVVAVMIEERKSRQCGGRHRQCLQGGRRSMQRKEACLGRLQAAKSMTVVTAAKPLICKVKFGNKAKISRGIERRSIRASATQSRRGVAPARRRSAGS